MNRYWLQYTCFYVRENQRLFIFFIFNEHLFPLAIRGMQLHALNAKRQKTIKDGKHEFIKG